MKKTIWTGTCSALVGLVTAAVTAQTPSPPQSVSASSEKSIVVTGCLKTAPSSPTDTAAAAGTVGTTGTAGTTGTTGAAGTTGTAGATSTSSEAPGNQVNLVLTNAAAEPADAAAAPSTTSTTSAAGAPAASTSAGTQTYRLIANPTALIPHVGKKLELTGTLDQDNASEPSAGPALRVKSGKVIAASCSE